MAVVFPDGTVHMALTEVPTLYLLSPCMENLASVTFSVPSAIAVPGMGKAPTHRAARSWYKMHGKKTV